MNAKEMFEELGYKVVEENLSGVKYVKESPLHKTIAIGKTKDVVFKGCDFLDSKEILAIYQQLLEFGWLEQKDLLQGLVDNYLKLEKELNDYRNIGVLYINDNGETSIKLYDKNYKLDNTLNRNAIPKIDLESEKQEIKKCKWCSSEIKENHRGYCSELCREYGEEWEYEKQLAIESDKR